MQESIRNDLENSHFGYLAEEFELKEANKYFLEKRQGYFIALVMVIYFMLGIIVSDIINNSFVKIMIFILIISISGFILPYCWNKFVIKEGVEK